MARPLRITYPGAFYHITTRGNERKAIFKNRADRQTLFCLPRIRNRTHRAAIHSYGLMNNHYHRRIGTPLKAIGERYGLGESGVSQAGRRLDKRKTDDAALEQVMAKIDRAIQHQIPQFDPGSIESCVETISLLDDQHGEL
ncbi:MAG: hypothetical protein PVG19_12430 [Desulfobacterales bacterium]|jgi:hypothetical protein